MLRTILAIVLLGTMAPAEAVQAAAYHSPNETKIPVERHGDWKVEVRKDMVGAYAEDKHGGTFGVACTQECVVYMAIGAPCTPGVSYPALINSNGTAIPVTIRCVIFEDSYVYLVDDDVDLVPRFEGGGKLGIAIPMRSGSFLVTDFSLQGALEAGARAIELAETYGFRKKKPVPDETQ